MINLIKFFRYETIETNDGLFLMLIILSIAGAGVDNDANVMLHKDFEPIVRTNSFIMASLIFIYLLF